MKSLTPIRCHFNGAPGWYLPLARYGLLPKRLYRRTKQELQAWWDEHGNALLEFGAAGYIPDDERLALIRARDMAEKLGVSLEDALKFYAAHAQRLKPLALDMAVLAFLEAKRKANKRKSTVRQLEWTLNDMVGYFGDAQECHLLTLDQIEAWAALHAWNNYTRFRQFNNVSVFFKYCKRRLHCVIQNPMDDMEEIEVDPTVPQIMTVEQCREALTYCLTKDPSLLCYLSLQLFGGLRKDEAMVHVTPAHFKCGRLGHIDLQGKEIKTRYRRLAPINETLACWLDVRPFQRLERNLEKRWSAMRITLGLSRNVIRHTAATMMLYRYGEAKAALIMGHSESVLHDKYKGHLSDLDQVDRFWHLVPIFSLDREPSLPA